MDGTLRSTPESERFLRRLLLVLIAVSVVLRCRLIFVLNVDGDEFRFLFLVYEHLRGRVGTPLMTFHAQLFEWLPWVSVNEVDQILAARIVMLGLSLGSALLTYLIAKKFLSLPGALFSLLCYLTFSNVVVHGASFRFDPGCSFFFLLSVYWLVFGRRLQVRSLLLAGTCLALALLISLKAVLFLPTAAAVLAIRVRFDPAPNGTRHWGWFAVGAVVLSVPLYWLHRGQLADGSEAGFAAAVRMARAVLGLQGLFPQWRYLLFSGLQNPVVWSLVILGLLITARNVFPLRRARKEDLLLLSLSLPLLSLSFYIFAYPYFLASIISPSVICCGFVFDRLYERMTEHRRHGLWLLMLIAAVFGGFTLQYDLYSEDQVLPQRRTLQAVHELFPEPVRYIDSCSMVSAYPQVGLFMTSWDLRKYFDRGNPIMRELLRSQNPVFLLADTYYLDLELPWSRTLNSGRFGLLEEDHRVLRDNFVRHWGAIYVPGKRIQFQAGEVEKEAEILVPGVYTLEAEGWVRIGGTLIRPGQTVRLARSGVTISPERTPLTVVLRWGNHLPLPLGQPPHAPLFDGYYWRSRRYPSPLDR
jgi:hypothetical protein